jgi:hypothetical protein
VVDQVHLRQVAWAAAPPTRRLDGRGGVQNHSPWFLLVTAVVYRVYIQHCTSGSFY